MNHTRMRLGLSHLRQQLHSFGIIPRPECTTCTNRLETVTHYLLHCSRYTGIHEEMMDGIRALVEVNGLNLDINNHRHMVNTLLHGNSGFDDDDVNQSIFNFVEAYISDSQRF